MGDGVPQGVEYRPPVGACSDVGPTSYEEAQLVKIVSISQDYYETLQRIIDSNTKRIVFECQAYLDRYERERRPRFAVGIDRIVGLLVGREVGRLGSASSHAELLLIFERCACALNT